MCGAARCEASEVCFEGGCAPSACPGATQPVTVVATTYDYQAGQYAPQKVQLTTLTDVCHMKGAVAEVVEGAKFVIDGHDPALQQAGTEEQLLNAIRKDAGRPIAVSLVERQGALVPADAASLEVTTAYYNLERAFSFFEKLGSVASFPAVSVYYLADFEQEGSMQHDNAFYMPLAKGVLLLPSDMLTGVSLAVNLGVLGHEYSLAVFNWRVHDAQALPRIPSEWAQLGDGAPGANLLASLEVGQADLFATGISCSDQLMLCTPDFFADSLPADFAEARRLDTVHCLGDGLWYELISRSYAEFRTGCSPWGCHYVLGTVFASALWRATQDPALVTALGIDGARKEVFRALWNAQAPGAASGTVVTWRELVVAAEYSQDAFSLKSQGATPSVLDAVIDGAEDPLVKTALCSAFLDRFGFSRNEIAHCPATAQSYRECVR